MATRTIDADRLIARVMRLSGGRLTAEWTASGIVKLVEEEAAVEENAGHPGKDGGVLW